MLYYYLVSPQWQEDPSNLAARMEDSSTDSEAEEIVDNDGPAEPATGYGYFLLT